MGEVVEPTLEKDGYADYICHIDKCGQTKHVVLPKLTPEESGSVEMREVGVIFWDAAAQAAPAALQGKVLSALAPLQKNLDELQQKVSNIEEGRKHEMGVLGEQLKGLGEQQARLDRETSSLSAALRNNKVRGAWGEAQLRNIVESAGLLEHVDFDTQVVMTGVDGKTLRPDMIVHLPGGKTIPFDA